MFERTQQHIGEDKAGPPSSHQVNAVILQPPRLLPGDGRASASSQEEGEDEAAHFTIGQLYHAEAVGKSKGCADHRVHKQRHGDESLVAEGAEAYDKGEYQVYQRREAGEGPKVGEVGDRAALVARVAECKTAFLALYHLPATALWSIEGHTWSLVARYLEADGEKSILIRVALLFRVERNDIAIFEGRVRVAEGGLREVVFARLPLGMPACISVPKETSLVFDIALAHVHKSVIHAWNYSATRLTEGSLEKSLVFAIRCDCEITIF